MKIVINTCYGGFRISNEAVNIMREAGIKVNIYDHNRTEPTLIAVVEELGERASGFGSRLKVVEIPEGYTDYKISSYDGIEKIITVYDGKIKYFY